MLSRTRQTIAVPKSSNIHKTVEEYRSPVRTMEVLFAPNLPNTACHYYIDEDGVKGLT